jgi:hypothetical protein
MVYDEGEMNPVRYIPGFNIHTVRDSRILEPNRIADLEDTAEQSGFRQLVLLKRRLKEKRN